MSWPASISWWGSTAEERTDAFGCDAVLPGAAAVLYRAVSVDAPPEVIFRWLCQLRVAPYSYDWLDNRGRRSPPELTEGLEQLAVGQRFMSIFELVSFETNREITLRMVRGRWAFGDVAVTYRVPPIRLVAKLLWSPKGAASRVFGAVAAPADLVMMRKQLLTLKGLAEGRASTRSMVP